jgi:hypothetical protein
MEYSAMSDSQEMPGFNLTFSQPATSTYLPNPLPQYQIFPKQTTTLIISNIPLYQLQELQHLLAQCGAIKVLNTGRLSERFNFL